MSGAIDPSLLGLNDCDCCEGITVQTPVEVYNRPGLNAIAYRVGTHAQFKQTLLAKLSTSKKPVLRGLTTRENSDFVIAFLDACAIGADVLTFYHERIANESYIRTTTERLSLLHLSRLIGYELRPGVAASTYLAFTVEDADSSPRKATIEIGSKVQSVPAPGEQPQTFETIEKLEARAEWNAIKPRQTRPQILSKSSFSILFKGISTKLKPGDMVWIVTETDKVSRKVRKVTVDNSAQQTLIEIQEVPRSAPFYPAPAYKRYLALGKVKLKKLDLQAIRTDISQYEWKQSDLASVAQIRDWDRRTLKEGIIAQQKLTQTPSTIAVYAFRTVAALFGYNAPPKLKSYTNNIPEFEEPTVDEKANLISLDNAYEGIAIGSFIMLQKPGSDPEIYEIEAVEPRPRTNYGLSAKTTILTVKPNWNPTQSFSLIRQTTVYAQSEELELADEPIPDPVEGRSILLNGFFPDLQVSQKVILIGERIDLPVIGSEVITIADIRTIGGYTQLNLLKALENSYHRHTLTINANVVLSTHGETVQETLGSGGESQSYQKFTLRQPPLTYISASTPSGAASTLQVRVNDLLWHEVSTLYGKGVQERVYVTRNNDEAKTTLIFNSHLPTGQDNVKATYRKGIGLGGLIKADQLSLLMTRPLGVKGVTNPQPSRGAEDPEALEQARRNAPLTVLTLDRIVSLQDYEDFARAFAGIGKALATWVWNGQHQGVFVTVAGPNGAFVDADSPLYQNLVDGMQKAGDRYIPLQVKSYRLALFRIKASIKINPDYLPDKVLEAVWQSLHTQFSFDARAFGQPVALSEAIAIIQTVPGVVAVDVDKFYRFGETEDLQSRLAAAAPQAGADGTVAAAELLLLDPNSSFDDVGIMP